MSNSEGVDPRSYENSDPEQARADKARMRLGSTVIAVLFIALAALLFYDTTTMVDRDSYIFPRAILAALVVLSTILIIRNLLMPGTIAHLPPLTGSNLRRIALVLIMFTGALATPFIGFLFAGFYVFVGLMVVAMYDAWTPLRLVLFPTIGIGIIFLFVTMFKRVLYVPLPEGSLF